MEIQVTNITQLRAEILRLRIEEQAQGLALKQRFNSPKAVFSTLLTIFPKSPDGAKGSGFFDQDMFGMLSRIVLPLTLNKTVFKNSNFITKALVGFLSQKASHFISEDSVTGIWDKVKGFATSFLKKDKNQEVQEEPHIKSAVL